MAQETLLSGGDLLRRCYMLGAKMWRKFVNHVNGGLSGRTLTRMPSRAERCAPSGERSAWAHWERPEKQRRAR